jgi:Fic family protein
VAKALPRSCGTPPAISRRRREPALDRLLRAAIAHFWFVTLHPFDDGNRRIARALSDLALAQGERQSIGFYAMWVAILAVRKGCYRQVEQAQRIAADEQALDLTPWLQCLPAQTAGRRPQHALPDLLAGPARRLTQRQACAARILESREERFSNEEGR